MDKGKFLVDANGKTFWKNTGDSTKASSKKGDKPAKEPKAGKG